MKTAPYGSWKSPITSDLIVAKSIGLSEVRLDGDDVYWLESRPEEAGRSVVVRNGEDLTPTPFNVRTRVHEYGGGAWTVANRILYFSHNADQRLYALKAGASPVPLTPEGAWRYADGIIDARRGLWIGIREDHTAAGEPINSIVSVPLEGAPDSGRVIASGHDFFSSPRLSPDGRWLTYLTWDHPHMPWQGSTLHLIELDNPGEPIIIAGGDKESIFQPEWSPDGSALIFVSDRTGWWNLYSYSLADRQTSALAPMDAEFGLPHWVFGMSTYSFAGPNRLVCSYISQGLGRLATLDLESKQLTPIDLPYTDLTYVRARGDRVVFRGGSSSTPGSIVSLDLRTRETQTLKRSFDIDPDVAAYFTDAHALEYPSGGSRAAFGLYYPAHNPDYQAADGEKPPLLVKCHGGPTAAASTTLDLRIQYWTSRGISVLDVNYGGSTGYGRPYRELLDGAWGIVDVEDCIHGVRHLAARGLVDGARCVITGGSAGGYTVLAALTFHDFFRGGASYYGVGDLTALANDTHKFESHYLDSLIGRYPERADLYRDRSPLSHVNQLSAPVIFLQGEEDRVVPPSQAESMVEALRAKGVPVGYLLFSGEQHGFRQAANIKRALDAELLFYAVNVFRTGLQF
ncbi:MAG TPA: prolyl oligopeptidase family serine peptidase [Bryobacteraceae bacterium]|nr:prolyl oligopeptidase family serine peptidase [Bryobacteraceae bacterium]